MSFFVLEGGAVALSRYRPKGLAKRKKKRKYTKQEEVYSTSPSSCLSPRISETQLSPDTMLEHY